MFRTLVALFTTVTLSGCFTIVVPQTEQAVVAPTQVLSDTDIGTITDTGYELEVYEDQAEAHAAPPHDPEADCDADTDADTDADADADADSDADSDADTDADSDADADVDTGTLPDPCHFNEYWIEIEADGPNPPWTDNDGDGYPDFLHPQLTVWTGHSPHKDFDILVQGGGDGVYPVVGHWTVLCKARHAVVDLVLQYRVEEDHDGDGVIDDAYDWWSSYLENGKPVYQGTVTLNGVELELDDGILSLYEEDEGAGIRLRLPDLNHWP